MKTFSALVLSAVFAFVPVAASASVDITLFGGDVVVSQGSTYNEPGYSAFSSFDGDITSGVFVSGTDTSSVGTFSIGYSVTDSNLDTATASRSLTVLGGGGSMPFCSGPSAPGWTHGLEGGGCGGTGIQIPAGTSVFRNGTLISCPAWFPGGCMVK